MIADIIASVLPLAKSFGIFMLQTLILTGFFVACLAAVALTALFPPSEATRLKEEVSRLRERFPGHKTIFETLGELRRFRRARSFLLWIFSIFIVVSLVAAGFLQLFFPNNPG